MHSLLLSTINLLAIILGIIFAITILLILYLTFFYIVPCWRYLFIITPKTKKIISERALKNSIKKWRKKIGINQKSIIKYEIRKFNLLNFFRSWSDIIGEKKYVVSLGHFGAREAVVVHELLHIKNGHFEKTENKNKLIKFLWYNVKFDNEINRGLLPKLLGIC